MGVNVSNIVLIVGQTFEFTFFYSRALCFEMAKLVGIEKWSFLPGNGITRLGFIDNWATQTSKRVV